MPLMDWARRRFGPTETQITSVGARHGRDVRVQSTGGKNRFLALSVDSDQKHTVGWEKVSRKLVECPQYWREFVSESIFGFSDCVFRITERRPKREDSIVARGDLSHYGETLQHLFETNRYDTGVTYLPRFRVSVKAIAEVILGIAKRLVNLHQSGQIHGDIKPQNVLLSREGPVLIDAFPLETGETTPGLSPGWAAPEQVLLQPVSEATDIYSLGVMLSSLLKGQLTGEIIQYVIPSPSDEQGRVISFIKNPSLYLDPSNRRVALQSRIAWLDFVEKCLRFDPRERPSNAKEFIEDFRDLLLRCPIEGSVEFGIRHNEYPLFARLANGQETACRIIKDDWDEYYSRSIWRQNDTK
jgi:serine/threonine protein kinase